MDRWDPGFAIWLTGLPSSGKSTLAGLLQRQLASQGVFTQLLDSDDLRAVLTPAPTYSAQERAWFYAVLVYIARLLTQNSVNVLIAATGQHRCYRAAARESIKRFAEVYVICHPEVCRSRDPKGLWTMVDEGLIEGLPGADLPYEQPANAEVEVDSSIVSAHDGAALIVKNLMSKGFFRPHQIPGHSSGE